MTEKKPSGPTNTILDILSNRTLMSLVKERKYIETISNDITQNLPQEYSKRVLSKEACLDLIQKDIKEQGEYQFAHNLTMKELKIWNRSLDTPPNLTASSDINNPNSPMVMKKRLKEELQKTSLEAYVRKANPSRKLLKESLELLGIDTPSKDRDELIGLLKYQVSALGLEYILHQLPIKLLQQMATEADLSINTTSKNLMVRHLVDMRDYRANKNRPKSTNKKTSDSEPGTGTGTGTSNNKTPSSQATTTSKKNRKPKPEDIDLVFDSDDSQDWNPNLQTNKLEDISIPSQDDADKDATSEDEEEDVDDDDYREHKQKKHRKRSSSHREERKKRQHYSEDEESSQEQQKRKGAVKGAVKGKGTQQPLQPPASGAGKEVKKDNSGSSHQAPQSAAVAKKKSRRESSEDS